jgi:hypothetical protein
VTLRTPVNSKPRGKRAAIAAAEARAAEKQAAKERTALGRVHVLVTPENLRPTNSYSTPDFVLRGYYVDFPFKCKSCGSSWLQPGVVVNATEVVVRVGEGRRSDRSRPLQAVQAPRTRPQGGRAKDPS